MKTLKYVIICGLFGGILGLLIGSGETTWVKKSQRNDVSPTYMLCGLAIGVISGLFLSNAISKEEKEGELFGFNTFNTINTKIGRKWVAQTTFINPQTSKENIILTTYVKDFDNVFTFLNNEPQLNHNSTSGSEKNIHKNHLDAIIYIKKKIVSGEVKLI